MQPAMSNDPYSNGKRGRVADDELAVRRRELVARCDEVGREVDADDALDEGRQRERERTGAAAAVERALGAVERRQELLDAILAAPPRAVPGSPARYPTTSLIDDLTLRSGGPRDDPAGDLIGDRA